MYDKSVIYTNQTIKILYFAKRDDKNKLLVCSVKRKANREKKIIKIATAVVAFKVKTSIQPVNIIIFYCCAY